MNLLAGDSLGAHIVLLHFSVGYSSAMRVAGGFLGHISASRKPRQVRLGIQEPDPIYPRNRNSQGTQEGTCLGQLESGGSSKLPRLINHKMAKWV